MFNYFTSILSVVSLILIIISAIYAVKALFFGNSLSSVDAKLSEDEADLDRLLLENQNTVVTIQVMSNGHVQNIEMRDEPHTTSDGTTIRLEGGVTWVTWINGVSCEIPYRSQKSGFQYYYPDGTKLSPGQTIFLPDGSKVRQTKL